LIALDILFYTAGDNAAAWIDAVSKALPEARIHLWSGAPVESARYALVWKPPPELVWELGKTKAVFNLGAGVDALANEPKLPRHVPLVRLEDAGMAKQMAEYVTYAILRRYREFDAYAEQQSRAVWRSRPRLDKRDFVIGILGMGVLGCSVAAALAPFDFALRGWSRTVKTVSGVESYAGSAGLDAFLGGCRVLVCLLPLTPDTRGLLNRETLSRLPQGAYVVNVSRGGLVVDDHLRALIDDGHISGAMLDVFQDEPLAPTHPFWHHPKISVTPHVSAVTLIDESVAQIANKIRRLEAGLPITGIVDPQRMY